MSRLFLALFAMLGILGSAADAQLLMTGAGGMRVSGGVLTITGITLSNASFAAGATSGTVVGTTQPTVTTAVSNPYGGTLPNVARVDQYVASMSNGQSNTSLLYVANSPNNRRVVIANMGHQQTCFWPGFNSAYGTTPLLQTLLSAGYSVFALNMPNCGDINSHNVMFGIYGSAAWRYFVEPAVQTMNYWDANRTFSRYDYVGLSGGGWTGAVLAALDPRVIVSIHVGGSMPGIQFVSPIGDSEQTSVALYSVAGYLDMYLMGAYGANRRQVQILNVADNCCFGPLQWTSADASQYNMDWWNFLAYYRANLASGAVSASILPERFALYEDAVANQHQISSWARAMIMNVLANATGGAHR